MKSKRMLMGAAVIGCVAATMMSGAYASGSPNPGPVPWSVPAANNRRTMLNRTHRCAGGSANTNAQFNARSNSKRTSANGQLERRGFAN